MHVFKFRPLANIDDLCRAKEILETGEFWCSKFSELNDPMEGSFHATSFEEIDKIYSQKELYKICSFSGEEAFTNPLMWGYYANGFRGIAIEIQVDNNELRQVQYRENIHTIEDIALKAHTLDILTTKLIPWGHEYEYRFLKSTKKNKNKIGKIVGLYFGNPYHFAANKDNIYDNSPQLSTYIELSTLLKRFAADHKTPYKTITMTDGNIIVNP